MTLQPLWPAIIRHDEVHDVIYVASHDNWINDRTLSQFPYNEHDILIDSQGSVFQLDYNRQDKSVSFIPVDRAISLEDFSLILRKHLCTLNECCISKISVSSYSEGFDMIRHSLDPQ